MADTVSDFLIKRLREWGVKRIYGYPGDGINGIMAALGRAGDNPRFIQARHEELAAFMACAHAKFTGTVGVCMATSGPGAIHLLNGLYDAKMDHQPVVAIVGQAATTALGSQYQQEVDLQNLFKDVASEFMRDRFQPGGRAPLHRPRRPHRAGPEVGYLRHHPQGHPGAGRGRRRRRRSTTTRSRGIGYPVPHVIPKEPELRAAAELLNGGKKVAMLVGAGALAATDEVIRVADVARGRHRQELAGQGRRSRRCPLRYRPHRPARHQAQLGHDAGVRHAVRRRLQLPLCRVLPAGRPGQRRADRPGRADAQPPLPDGRQPQGRREGDPAGADPAAGAQERPLLAGEAGGGDERLVEVDRGAGHDHRQPDQPGARLLGTVTASCRTTASWPPTAARPPTGSRATCGSGAA